MQREVEKKVFIKNVKGKTFIEKSGDMTKRYPRFFYIKRN